MFSEIICLTEQHDGWVAPLALLVCWVSAHTSLRLLDQSGQTWRIARWLWLGTAGFSAGAGVWSTHFIGMLGYDPGVAIGYGAGLTLLSLTVAILAAIAALAFLQRAMSLLGAAVAGVLFGFGVGAMHFLGMAGVEVPGALVWDHATALTSVLIGATLGAAAFAAYSIRRSRFRIEIAATLLTAAIAILHFMAMSAVEIIPDATLSVAQPSLPRLTIASSVAAIMLAVLGFAVFALFTERTRHANRALRASEQRFRLLAENTTDVIIWSDLNTRRKYVSPAAKKVLEYEPEELLGTRPLDFVHPDDAEAYTRILADLTSGRTEHAVTTQRYRRRGGDYSWIEASFSLIRSPATGLPDGYVASLRDVTARKEADLQIAHMALHDALTGLPNRLLFRDRLNQELLNARRLGGCFAVLACDLDQFKIVNDTLGHPAGDKLLCAVSDRLKTVVRDIDTVARLGGDEFALILSRLEGQEVTKVAERLIEIVGRSIDIDGQPATVGVSIGIAMGSLQTPDADTLFKQADIALYRAKAGGRNTFAHYQEGSESLVAERGALEQDLRAALHSGSFAMEFQPVMKIGSSELVGFEALMRWRHPDRGVVSPADFIPVAEELGLIVPMGIWALQAACREAATWPNDLRVAVNVSAVQLQKPGLEEAVISALATSGLSAERLELEITESVLMADAEAAIACLHRLRALGVRVALDDFGTGFSSLSYLRRFPFDKIKIDRSFVHEIADPDTAAIVRAIVGIGSRLGATVTAEGVETAEQLRLVRREGCNEAQGFLFSRALPAHETRNFVQIRRHLRLIAHSSATRA